MRLGCDIFVYVISILEGQILPCASYLVRETHMAKPKALACRRFYFMVSHL